MLNVEEVFSIRGMPRSCVRYGNGHINETYLLKTDAPHTYILQKINSHIFQDVPALMQNIESVTKHLMCKDQNPRHVLTLVSTKEGRSYAQDADGESWRVYEFVTGSRCLDRVEIPSDFYESAVAFGRFQTMLSDFDASTLHETIPHFHDTPVRYDALKQAVAEDRCQRLSEVSREVEFALERERDAHTLMTLQRQGELPLRVTHNDTKLNNVMLDASTRKALCVIDLDTVMPGLAANDFGDSIRFGANTAAEDERDLTMVHLSLELYKTYVKGFLSECGDSLTAREIETLPWGAKLMTLECGVRFLTDYLQGDTYFAVHRPQHNLDRCRTQFQLVAEMERHWDEMYQIIENLG